MTHSIARVLVHFVWATWRRTPLIDASVESSVRRAVASQADRLGCFVCAFGAFDDHVHVVIELAPTAAFAEVARAMKAASARLVAREFPALSFRWQDGYAVFSVAAHDAEGLLAYVRDQRLRHARRDVTALWEIAREEEPVSG